VRSTYSPQEARCIRQGKVHRQIRSIDDTFSGIVHMSYPLTDLLLAIVHHLLIFSFTGVLAYEMAMIRPEISSAQILRVARVDIWYGIVAILILAIGLSRAILTAKGWTYYSANYFFWAKIATFILVGLLSIYPTIVIFRWRRDADKFPTSTPCLEDVIRVRRFLRLEALGIAFILVFAAAMARGYGQF
jgi:putative membrane protein